MKNTISRLFTALLASCALGLFSGSIAAAVISYNVTVNTSDIAGVAGQIDMQFNPAVDPAVAAQAVVSGFTTNGTLAGAPTVDGTVVGDLGSSLTFSNGTTLNAYLDGFTFGTAFSFLITFSGDFLTAPSLDATAFSLSLYDLSFNPLGSLASSSSLLSFELVNGGVITNDTSSPVGNDQLARLAVTDAPASVPAPAGILLLAFGAFAMVQTRTKRA
jgi:hypothetical protein